MFITEVVPHRLLITNILFYLEPKPLGESDTITEGDLVGLTLCSVTVSSISLLMAY